MEELLHVTEMVQEKKKKKYFSDIQMLNMNIYAIL